MFGRRIVGLPWLPVTVELEFNPLSRRSVPRYDSLTSLYTRIDKWTTVTLIEHCMLLLCKGCPLFFVSFLALASLTRKIRRPPRKHQTTMISATTLKYVEYQKQGFRIA